MNSITRAIVCLTLLLPACAFAETPEGFRELFNGENLDGWDGDPQFWSEKDGAITGQTTPDKVARHNTFLIWKEAGVGDFELRVTYKIVGGNSGVQYRSKDMGDYVVGGYQADIVAGDPDKYSGILYEEKGTRGIMANRGEVVKINPDGSKQITGSLGDARKLAEVVKKEDWNEYTIIAQGDKLIHKINGTTTMECTDADATKSAKEGILALQIHVGPPMTVQFKNIRIKESKAEPKKPAK